MGRYKDPNTGNWVREKAMPIGDTLPIGSEVDYDGSVVPYGWEQIDDNPKVLWTNPSPRSTFAAQSVTLSDSIEDYKYYEIIYNYYSDGSSSQTVENAIYQSTGKLVYTKTRLFTFDEKIRFRNVTISGSTASFEAGKTYDSYGNSSNITTTNFICIPYQILGYK